MAGFALQLFPEQRDDLSRGRPAITVLPDQRGNPIQTVDLMPFKVIDNNLICQGFDDQAIFPGLGHGMSRACFHTTFNSNAPRLGWDTSVS
jgi:hypothetical protein